MLRSSVVHITNSFRIVHTGVQDIHDDGQRTTAFSQVYRPNSPPNKLPPPPPALPPLRASFSNHSLTYSLFRIRSGFVSLVSNCASCLLNASSVGMEVICTHHISTASSHYGLRCPYHVFDAQVSYECTVQFHFRKSQPSLFLSHTFVFNHPFDQRLHSLACRAPASAPQSYQGSVVGGGKHRESVQIVGCADIVEDAVLVRSRW